MKSVERTIASCYRPVTKSGKQCGTEIFGVIFLVNGIEVGSDRLDDTCPDNMGTESCRPLPVAGPPGVLG